MENQDEIYRYLSARHCNTLAAVRNSGTDGKFTGLRADSKRRNGKIPLRSIPRLWQRRTIRCSDSDFDHVPTSGLPTIRKLDLRILNAFGAMATKCVDSSSSSENFSTVEHSTSDEIFLASPQWYAFPIDDQCVASLHNNHVFVVVVGVGCRCRGVAAGPKCHLTAVFTVKNIALNSRSRLIGPRYPVCRMFHELGKIVHNAHSVPRQQKVALPRSR
jgi:hypothetical protein